MKRILHIGRVHYVCRLDMALYGVPKAGQCWNLTLRNFLVDELGFKCTEADPNLYVRIEPDGNFCIFPTVVDDTLDVCSSEELRKEIHDKLFE